MLVWCNFAADRASRWKRLQLPWVEQGVGGQHLDGDVPAQRELLRLVDDTHAATTHLTQDLVIPQLLQRRRGRGPGQTLLTGGIVGGLGLFHEHQGGQHVADLVRLLGVTPGELLDRGTLSLPERFHELVGDLPERVRGG